ncbi:vanadium-dependent haloperoxidase [Caenimonas sedimenti]|uniref:Vanadium-dependent haloperoxidase n=1 Tax=Caenimonas sedimenti TaxID=2596921 RepID=A0A562ZPH5_9BURK|nr:vanadium-dependent haloperoxidase [Caenimonas sedimenti]TWO70281.1 vanadium-dependent haloperoxidase [Caenimonas sedimenti]
MKTLSRIALAASLLATFHGAQADAVTDWNTRTGDWMIEARLGTPPAIRISAIVQTAVFDALNNRAPGASADAAVAAAHRATLAKLMPAQEAAVGTAYQAALAAIADGPAKVAGIEAGEKAAAAVLAARADDGATAAERYRPATAPGAYVPTAVPAVPQWPQRKTWVLAKPDQFRAPPPPALTSPEWARDFNEVKTFGSRTSTVRNAEQTEIGRFWEFSLPPIYNGVVRSVAQAPGRDVLQNARLFAAAAQAMDDAMIAVWDSKYHYNFWRPITAIRNGDADGNDATERDAGWAPLIDAPLHPEYPSAHSILAAAVGTVLKAETLGAAVPALSTTSPSAKGVTRRWTRIDDFMNEVAQARVYEGIHYRFSTDAGLAMGRKVGEAAVRKHFGAAAVAAVAQ